MSEFGEIAESYYTVSDLFGAVLRAEQEGVDLAPVIVGVRAWEMLDELQQHHSMRELLTGYVRMVRVDRAEDAEDATLALLKNLGPLSEAPPPVPDQRSVAKLTELCDADRRATNPSTRAVATAITTPSPGTPMPTPYAERDQMQALLDQVAELLHREPSSRTVRAAGHRLTVAIGNLADQIAKEAG